ncbi:MAG: carbamoyltransferase [Candidatus Portnoybacteria bacterium]|nr:carbamoyltransferase [Candidatus Portnoybacteria bacterium]MDD4982861.1 carbamoyltransferase [Candidatus Portnoybacteria bacterium]
MYILGISCFFHDSSAALLKDGRVVAAIQEERLTRKKHDNSFPSGAIDYCLSSQGILIDEIDFIVFYEKPLLKFERLLCQFIETFPRGWRRFLAVIPVWLGERLRIMKAVRKKLGYKKSVLFVEHHQAHAAGSFFCSPFEKAAILTVDGAGEWATTAYGFGDKDRIKLAGQINFPHSLGLFYSAITAYLGFPVNDSEYKVMGLGAYGEKDKLKNIYYEKLRGAIDIKEDGSFRIDMSYFEYHYAGRMPSSKLCSLLGGPVREKDSSIEKRHQDIAAALQMITEEAVFKILNHLYDIYKCKNIILAGGVALNSVLNGKIPEKTKFKNVWIQPNAADGGTSLGAALFAYHQIFANGNRRLLPDAYLGPEYSDQEIKEFLDRNRAAYHEFADKKELVEKTARLIFEDKIIGWFQGREEWGPRALGARSILANPLNPKMKDILNLGVKHRENFRPFAPAVCREDAGEYFKLDKALFIPAEYMLAVCPIKKYWQTKIPAVCHIDGTARPQIVKRSDNPPYYDLIKKFGKISGVPILVNTSFNINREPIVSSLKDAYLCFLNTGIDYLVMGNFLIKKQ